MWGLSPGEKQPQASGHAGGHPGPGGPRGPFQPQPVSDPVKTGLHGSPSLPTYLCSHIICRIALQLQIQLVEDQGCQIWELMNRTNWLHRVSTGPCILKEIGSAITSQGLHAVQIIDLGKWRDAFYILPVTRCYKNQCSPLPQKTLLIQYLRRKEYTPILEAKRIVKQVLYLQQENSTLAEAKLDIAVCKNTVVLGLFINLF